MFQSKSKIFAASVLGVSILLVISLVSFTIYFVTKSNAAYDGTSVGYIIGDSYDESYKVSQQLLKDKLVQHALVVPTVLHNQKESPGKVVSVATPSYLLLVQTSAELIPGVNSAVKKAFKGSNNLQVIFSPVAKGTPLLFFAPPTAPRSQAATKDAPVSARVVGTAAATDRSSITNSVRLSPDNADRQNGNFLRKLAAITDSSFNPGEGASWSTLDMFTCDISSPQNAAVMVAQLGTPFIIKVKGTRKAGYIWQFGSMTSTHLEIKDINKYEDSSMLAEALLYLMVTPKQTDFQNIELVYIDPAGSGPPMVKVLTVFVGITRPLQL